jgi:mannose-6-phosphate isomerase class I
MTEIIPAVGAGGFVRDDRAKAEIADPKHFPEIVFAFQLCCFREFSALAKELKKITIFQLSRSALDNTMVPIPCLTQKNFEEIKENAGGI